MTPEKKHLLALVSKFLKPLGFKKKNTTWNLDKKDFVFVANVQTGWGNQYFINLGLYIIKIGSKKGFIYEGDCQIGWRLYKMDPNLRSEAHEIDFNSVSEKMPLHILADVENIIEKELVPLIRILNSLSDIEEFIKSKPGYLGMTLPVQELFCVSHFA